MTNKDGFVLLSIVLISVIAVMAIIDLTSPNRCEIYPATSTFTRTPEGIKIVPQDFPELRLCEDDSLWLKDNDKWIRLEN